MIILSLKIVISLIKLVKIGKNTYDSTGNDDHLLSILYDQFLFTVTISRVLLFIIRVLSS
jgi:hypothetical protein